MLWCSLLQTELVEKSSDAKVRCIHCGRERKQSIARNGKFCSQRCILQWLADHPEKTLEDAIANAAPSSSTLRKHAYITIQGCTLNNAHHLLLSKHKAYSMISTSLLQLP